MNMILEILGTLLALAFLYLYRNNGKGEGDKEPEVKVKLPQPTVDIYVEKLGDIYYAWENNVKFLFQHEDPNEVAKMLLRKYPNHKLNIHEKPL